MQSASACRPQLSGPQKHIDLRLGYVGQRRYVAVDSGAETFLMRRLLRGAWRGRQRHAWGHVAAALQPSLSKIMF